MSDKTITTSSEGSKNIKIKVSTDKKFISINPPFLVINTSKIICIYPEEDKKDDKIYLVIELDIASKKFRHYLPVKTKEESIRLYEEIFSKI
jgi:hypothetical protein